MLQPEVEDNGKHILCSMFSRGETAFEWRKGWQASRLAGLTPAGGKIWRKSPWLLVALGRENEKNMGRNEI
jgi:hypothetical protein